MQEMVELSHSQAQTPDSAPLSVSFSMMPPGATVEKKISLSAGPAHFGREIKGDEKVNKTTSEHLLNHNDKVSNLLYCCVITRLLPE
jgi:hypothetical protein